MTATWVFHRGGLGDSVLLWPMLRAIKRTGPVTLVTDGSLGRLAQRWLGVEPVDGQQMRFLQLWVESPRITPVAGVDRVISFHPPAPDAVKRMWLRSAGAMFPGARITLVRRRPDRRFALRWSARGPAVALPSDPAGPVLLHVGAGSEDKRWPLERWVELASRLRATGAPCRLLAGEVELERFSADEQAMFDSARAEFLFDPTELGQMITAARAVVCADSGPGHLAAQLGVPTVSLFGPTNPAQWAPVGPRTTVLAPQTPRPMRWLEVDAVIQAPALAGSGGTGVSPV
ncbi:MAG: glycosyltransferase family 9 protein, partial [Phycisphaerales bacterium JB039]